jgi:hypothetical protein
MNLFKKNYNKIYSSDSAKNNLYLWYILGGIFILAFLMFFIRPSFFSFSENGKYQAIFLSNGQVYFGELVEKNKDELVLKNIFYIQAGQQNSGSAENQPSLIKLGNELHGPADLMHITRSQVLFYEDLKSDSSISRRIDEYKATGK